MVKAPRRQLESKLQQGCVKWFAYQYPQYKGLLFSIPNEGIRSAANAARMKAEGMVSGMPDLMLAVPKGNYHGLFIEMKSEKGRLNDNQKRQKELLENQNYWVRTVNSLEVFMLTVNTYFKQSPAKVNNV